MKTSGFAVKASLIASLISGQAFAQSLPDEINHTQYLRVYQNLEQVLNQKISQHEKLATQKDHLEKTIAQMERNLVELPERTSELRGIIAYKRQEVSRLQSEIAGMEILLDRILDDLRHSERVLDSISSDINQETSRNQMIQSKRNQQGQQVARFRSLLQKEIKEENQSLQKIENLTNAIIKARENIQQGQGALAQLEKDMEKFKGEITSARNTVAQNNSALAAKRPLLQDVQAKLPVVKNEIASLQAQIRGEQTALNQKKAELAKLKREQTQGTDHSGRIAALENEINSLNNELSDKASRINRLEQDEALINSQIKTLALDIKNLEAQITRLNGRISEMERAISSYPENKRKLEAQIKKGQDEIAQNTTAIEQEHRLLVRIRRDRKQIENDLRRAENVMEAITQDLITSDRVLINMRNKFAEESRNRENLQRYQQDNQAQYNSLQSQKVSAERDVVSGTEEIRSNDQHLAAISKELPYLREDLVVITPEVARALKERNTAQRNTDEANSQYQARLNLYQRYLTEAHEMGSKMASLGTPDGTKAGNLDGEAKGTKLATENASQEAKWEALRRSYVRGEISGYTEGYKVGYASETDRGQGETDGEIAGAARARNHADNVIKPEFYLEELARRLKNDKTSLSSKSFALLKDELKSMKSLALLLRADIPDLSAEEIAAADKIISSLDNLIAQSTVEIKEVLALRNQLAAAGNVYLNPAPGVNANNVNCSAVYKGVKDYVEACKGSYAIRYQNLYNVAHKDAFKLKYEATFKNQISKVFSTELNRLYPVYLNEATLVGKNVGIAAGKKEIYQQIFERSEENSYNVNLPSEVVRVEAESVEMVQDYLNDNSALTLKENARLTSPSPYGIAPGTEIDLKMMVKNIGSQASIGSGLVKLTSISGNVSTERREVVMATVPAHSHAELNVMLLRVSDKAEPGTKVVLAGEIIYPGNHYRSNRIEQFKIEQEIKINPSINLDVQYEKTPRVSVRVIGMVKTHVIAVSLMPKFLGVDQGYEIVLEEVGSDYAQILTKPTMTEVLGQGVEKKVFLNYKLSKAARGKTINFKLIIKNNGKIVSSQDIPVQAI